MFHSRVVLINFLFYFSQLSPGSENLYERREISENPKLHCATLSGTLHFHRTPNSTKGTPPIRPSPRSTGNPKPRSKSLSLGRLAPFSHLKKMFHNQTLQQLNHKLVKEQINRDVAELHVTECHQNIATLQSKRYHLRTLIDRLEQEQQEAQEKTKAAVDSFSRLDQLVKSIELDIRFAQNQLKLYNTILYNTHADVLDACPLNKHEILAKMEKEKVHDPTSMDDFISLLYVEGYLCEDPATGGSAPTTVSEQEGETKEAVVQVDVGTDASSTLTAPPTHGETKEVTNANPTIPSVPTTIPQGETK